MLHISACFSHVLVCPLFYWMHRSWDVVDYYLCVQSSLAFRILLIILWAMPKFLSNDAGNRSQSRTVEFFTKLGQDLTFMNAAHNLKNASVHCESTKRCNGEGMWTEEVACKKRGNSRSKTCHGFVDYHGKSPKIYGFFEYMQEDI